MSPTLSPEPLYACLHQLPLPGQPAVSISTLLSIAREFSPRYERHGDDLVSIDVCGLGRLLGDAQSIGKEIGREADARGVRVHVALAARRTAALVLALARPGLTIVEPGGEAAAIAPLPVGILGDGSRFDVDRLPSPLSTFTRWGIRTLGELAALPAGDVVSRLGPPALFWQGVARGEDLRPLVPTLEEERFVSSLDLDWPIEGLERRDRGAAALHVELGLATRGPSLRQAQGRPEPGRGTREIYARHLQLPSPIRDVRTLRTLALLDLDAHPPPAAIDRVTIVIDPAPGRVLQHALFTRAHPTPDQLSTLVARLGALMGQDRIGRAASVDSHRPGAFAMAPFATDHGRDDQRSRLCAGGVSASLAGAREKRRAEAGDRGDRLLRGDGSPPCAIKETRPPLSAPSALNVVSALRRCRQPVPARVAVARHRPLRDPVLGSQRGCRAGDPVRVTTDRRGFAGGSVVHCAGPWRTSGEWWMATGWNRDEWDVALNDGAVYRIFRDLATGAWFIDAIVD